MCYTVVVNPQFKKGVLELCVLASVGHKDTYGYQLVERISRHVEVTEGTIYPLLRRLTKEGYFETYLSESAEGPPRKYYRLTAKGVKFRNTVEGQWKTFVEGVSKILDGDDLK